MDPTTQRTDDELPSKHPSSRTSAAAMAPSRRPTAGRRRAAPP
ncbi:hypothetical protein ACFQL0_05200 [Haloplanus litoreus]